MTQAADTGHRGLTHAEVDERIADGRVNAVPDAPERTFGQILFANAINPVNGIIGTMLVLILIAGYPQDALFAGVVISNTVIGVAQELQARRAIRKLELLSAPKARVMRDGATSDVGVSQIVADDLVEIGSGDQVVVDGEVVDAIGLELDESLLTGESDPIEKSAGDEVMSGSFVSAGSGYFRATRIGAESYAVKLAEEAKRFKLANSELRGGVNLILKWLTIVIPPAAVLLLLRLLGAEETDSWHEALQGTVAAAVAMVPDGLVLLTSLAMISGVLALARRRTLAKELVSVELLARVDTLCLDKTGTITTGEISLTGVEALGAHTDEAARAALGAMAATDPSPNATLAAIVERYPSPGWAATDVTPFSSARKYAGAAFEKRGTYYLGAPDILLGAAPADGDGDLIIETTRQRVADHAAEGRRVLLLVRTDAPYAGEQLAPDRQPVALVLLEDTVRPDAPEILEYFRGQGVDLKVISGDHPQTVAAVARRAGVPGATQGYDTRDLPDDPEALAEIVDRVAVFGRVTPHQKRAMVGALQSRGRTVAMTGDGVNDVLALKDADMGIAMGDGSSATRSVAQLVLLDNAFGTLPRVLAEGRRVINNIERVANLFICKATYAVLLTLMIGISGVPFPLLPRHLTLIGTFSIGIPGFFLALAANTQLVKPGFIDRVLRFSLPAGTAAAVVTYLAYEITRDLDGGSATLPEARTAATITLLGVGLVILVTISRPLRPWKIGLAGAMGAGYVAIMSIPWPRDFFELEPPPTASWPIILAAIVVGGAAVIATPVVMHRFFPEGLGITAPTETERP